MEQNNLMVFSNEEFGQVRSIMIDGVPYFVGKDVADILGYANPSKALSDHVDEEDKLNNESLSSLGQRGGWVINESGLYSLILSSKLPAAKKFKRWVTSEVLPSIRKQGMYIPNWTTEDKIKILATGMDEITERVTSAEERIAAIENDLNVLDAGKNAGKLLNLQRRVKARAYQLVSGNSVYETLWARCFIADNYGRIKRTYDIARIGQLPVKNYETAMDIASTWTPTDVYLENKIAQMQGEKEKNLLSDKKVIALLQYLQETKTEKLIRSNNIICYQNGGVCECSSVGRAYDF